MKFHLSGLVVAAAFFGLLWYALDRGVDYGVMGVLVVVALDVAFGGLLFGVVGKLPWPRRRTAKSNATTPILLLLISVATASAAEPRFVQSDGAAASPGTQIAQGTGSPRQPSFLLQQTLKPKVVCGMTLLPADPKVDPRIFYPASRANGKPLIRTIAPSVCSTAKAPLPAPNPPAQR